MRAFVLILVNLSLLYLTGCEPKAVRYRTSKASVPPTEEKATPAPYTWQQPEAWQPGPAFPMRLASFTIPIGDTTADCSLMRLAGEGGGLVANINRWRAQIGLSPLDEPTLQQHIQQLEGKSGSFSYIKFTNHAQPDKAILAAIFPGPDEVLFAKLAASLKNVQTLEAPFIIFCQSIQRVNQETVPGGGIEPPTNGL